MKHVTVLIEKLVDSHGCATTTRPIAVFRHRRDAAAFKTSLQKRDGEIEDAQYQHYLRTTSDNPALDFTDFMQFDDRPQYELYDTDFYNGKSSDPPQTLGDLYKEHLDSNP